jgi:hypothetical protein
MDSKSLGKPTRRRYVHSCKDIPPEGRRAVPLRDGFGCVVQLPRRSIILGGGFQGHDLPVRVDSRHDQPPSR